MRLTRTVVASLVLTLALIAGGLALAAATLVRSVGDPGRVGAVAAAELADPAGRRVAAGIVTDRVMAVAPNQSSTKVRAEVDAALADPKVAALITQLVTLDRATPAFARSVSSLTARAAAAVGSVDPALGRAVAATDLRTSLPRIPTQLPSSGLVDRAAALSRLLGLAALVGVGVALLVSGDRRRVMWRTGRFLLSATVVSVLLFFVAPIVLGHVGGDSWQATGVALRAWGAPLVPWMLMGAAGGALLLMLALSRPPRARGPLPA